MTNEFSYRTGDWQQLRDDAAAVRTAVFVHEQGIPQEFEWDRWDAGSVHAVAYDGLRPIGTGRLLPDAHIGRMAVLAEYRGKGVGGQLLGRLIEEGERQGVEAFELSSQQAVNGFYRRFGFETVGEPYDEVGIAHQRMRRVATARATAVRLGESKVRRPDGCELYRCEWQPTNPSPGRGIYLFHGLGEHVGRYDALARWLCERGWRVAGHDHRGHGKSDGPRGALSAPDDLLTDGQAMFDEFAASLGARPVLIGHSMGGALAAQAVVVRHARVSGLVLSSPALDIGLNGLRRRLIDSLNRVLPGLSVSNGLDPTFVSRDPAVVAAYLADPLVHPKITPRLASWLAAAGDQALVAAPTLAVETLLLVAAADRLVKPEGSRRFANRAPRERLTLRWFEGCYHELFNEIEPARARVLADLDAWLHRLP